MTLDYLQTAIISGAGKETETALRLAEASVTLTLIYISSC